MQIIYFDQENFMVYNNALYMTIIIIELLAL